jgi:hypothetical protein
MDRGIGNRHNLSSSQQAWEKMRGAVAGKAGNESEQTT